MSWNDQDWELSHFLLSDLIYLLYSLSQQKAGKCNDYFPIILTHSSSQIFISISSSGSSFLPGLSFFFFLLRFSHFQESSSSTESCFPLWSWYWKSWSVLSWCSGLKDCLEASPGQGWSQGFPKYGPGSSQATGTPGSSNDRRPTNTHYCWVCMPGPGSLALSSPHPRHSTSLDNHRWHLDWRNLTGITAHSWTPWPRQICKTIYLSMKFESVV